MSIDFDSINAWLLSNYFATLERWLPNGKKIGPNWCVGSLAGEPGDSLKIHVRKGIWADFATGDKGSDPVSLYAALHGIGQGEAAKRLGGTTQQAPVKKSPEPVEIELDPVLNPPEDMPDPKRRGTTTAGTSCGRPRALPARVRCTGWTGSRRFLSRWCC